MAQRGCTTGMLSGFISRSGGNVRETGYDPSQLDMSENLG